MDLAAELTRMMNDIRDKLTEVGERVARVETRLDSIIDARDKATEALQIAQDAQRRVKRLESHEQWVVRSILLIIIGAVMGLILKGGVAG